MSRYYPVYLALTGKRCLVVGGGKVAERKTLGLLDAGAQVRVVSLSFTPGLQSLAKTSRIEAITAPYAPSHLEGAKLVFAATDSRDVNGRVTADAAERGIPANVADAPEESDFITPSVVRRGDLCISVSTGGNQPMLAARICDELEARYGPEYAQYVELLGRIRDYLKENTDDYAVRQQTMARLLEHDAELRELLRGGDPEAAQQRAWSLIEALT
jgi:precorrin-2 dehydrogenase / sirohydrochlorin ferrochelatase